MTRRRGGVDRVLVLNAGSSTLKASLLRADATAQPIGSTVVDWGGDPVERAPAVVGAMLDEFGVATASGIAGVGHRIVHGGPDLVRPMRIDDAALAALRAVVPLAPLHVPPSLAVIEAIGARLPAVPQVACFDTAFHARMPETARRYPVPASWTTDGIRRYGFHGLSVEWATERAASLLGVPVSRLQLVVAHLGAGASVTAVERGRSVDTSMGYTPLEGLMMATRSGSIDPGIVTSRLRAGGRAIDDIDDDLLHRSGLLGVGGSADMRTLVTRAAGGDAAARLGIAMFVDRAAAGIAAAATRLASVDALVFTGGIGEGAAGVRSAIVRRLGVLGIASIDARRRIGDRILSARGATPAVLRIEAREDLVIARAVLALR